MTTRFHDPVRRALCATALLFAAAGARADGCAAETGIQACQDLGTYTAGVVRVAPSDTPLDSQVQVRTLAIVVRLHNTGTRPLVLAYQDGSLRVVDNNGHAFSRAVPPARRVAGIGVAKGKSADPQLQLQPGQSREIRFEVGLSYRTRNHKPFGDELTAEFTLAELRLPNATQIEFVRDHALSLSGARVSALGAVLSGDGGATQAGNQLLQDLHKLANRKK